VSLDGPEEDMTISETTGADRSAPPRRGELIRSALDGKLTALSGYDQIIWKIRAGYAAVIFGSLTLLLGKDGGLLGKEGSITEYTVLVLLVCGFSFAGGWLDYDFSKRKRRVVISRDTLIDYLWDDKLLDNAKEAKELLHISGEATDKPFYIDENSAYREDLKSSRKFFGVTPLLLVILLTLLLIYRPLKEPWVV
jgi:hypothetical protein